MNRKEAMKYITEKINAGEPKHVLYKELLSKVPYKEDLLAYLSQIPDLDKRKKYNNINTVLLVVLILLFIAQIGYSVLLYKNIKSEHIAWLILGGFGYTLLPIFLIFTIVEVWRFRGQGYRYVFIISFMVLGFTIRDVDKFAIWLLFSSPWFLTMYLSHRIMKNVFPYDRLFRGIDKEKMGKDLLITQTENIKHRDISHIF